MALARWEFEVLMQPGDVPTLADLFPARPAWMAEAACRGTETASFFPSRGEPTAEAREMCGRCPVAGPCLAYAVAEELDGVWAGTSKRERRLMRQNANMCDCTSGTGKVVLQRCQAGMQGGR